MKIKLKEALENVDNVVIYTNIISALVKDEWEAVDGYNSAILAISDIVQDDDTIGILKDIIAEEYVHIGQLEKLIQSLVPESNEIETGAEEAAEQISDETDEPLVVDESVEQTNTLTSLLNELDATGSIDPDDMKDMRRYAKGLENKEGDRILAYDSFVVPFYIIIDRYLDNATGEARSLLLDLQYEIWPFENDIHLFTRQLEKERDAKWAAKNAARKATKPVKESLDSYEMLKSKSVSDTDGFNTDYTLYKHGDNYVCILGDNDVYTPENTDPDFETDSEQEAFEWFDNYETEDNNIDLIDDDIDENFADTLDFSKRGAKSGD